MLLIYGVTMIREIHLFLLVALVQLFVISGFTDLNDFAGLEALRNEWNNFPANWKGADPCENSWDGIRCSHDRVVSITLLSINLTGQLSSDIEKLSELQILDLSYNKDMTGPLPATIGNLKKLTSLILVGCGFSGPIPDSIGTLQQLAFLSLNFNKFIGEIPHSIGNLSNLYWLDLADNHLSGTIPVSNGTVSGLDKLLNAKHFHLGRNKLSGEIPPHLFNPNLTLIHLLLENNQLTGRIPSTLGLVQSMEIIRLDKNMLDGSVPKNLNNLTSVQGLYLANNHLDGPLPELTGMNSLSYADMSNNSFNSTVIPQWFSSLHSLTSLIMENTQLQGQLPISLFNLSQLQTVSLKNNLINGTVDIGSSFSSQLQLIDLQNNSVEAFTVHPGYNGQIKLVNNPVCKLRELENYCTTPSLSNSSYQAPQKNCTSLPCSSDKVSGPNCKCAYPYSGTISFRAPSFSNFGNSSVFASLHNQLMKTCQALRLPVDSVALSNPSRNADNYLVLSLQFFPSGLDHFNYTGVYGIASMLSNPTFNPPPGFGPFYFIGNSYPYFPSLSTGSRKVSIGIIIGAVVGGFVLLLLLVFAGFYALRQKRMAEAAVKKSDPFASWNSRSSGDVPHLTGSKCFSFEELQKCTNNFSDDSFIGRGGYGKVYKGTLRDGQVVAIKRAEQGRVQGGMEFKTEIELLSRVHHKNVVSLVGFCFDQGEQMLVYEFIANGTLKDSLSGRSRIRLNWTRRLQIAVGAARGLQYLHDLVNPPIIHRDVKSNNILLDERLNAKVADFGLSKPLGDPQRSHVTTQIKGTIGYLDPEYYMTNQLTEKSDVYSFGILLLEILTAKSPIERGMYIVQVVKQALDKTKDMYNLHEIVDPIILYTTSSKSIEKFVDLAMRCLQDSGGNRPHMSQVVKEIEIIMELHGLHTDSESVASTSESTKSFEQLWSSESGFSHSLS